MLWSIGPHRPWGSTVMGMRTVLAARIYPMISSPDMVDESTGSAHPSLFSFCRSFFCACSSAAAVTDSITCAMVPEGVEAGVVGMIVTSPPIQSYGQVAGAEGEGSGSMSNDTSSGFRPALRLTTHFFSMVSCTAGWMYPAVATRGAWRARAYPSQM